MLPSVELIHRTLYDSPLVSVGHFRARPVSSAWGPVDRVNVVTGDRAGHFAANTVLLWYIQASFTAFGLASI